MPLMSTCLARLGSRYNLILDPIRREVSYGSLGLFCQFTGEMVIGLDDGQGHFNALPLSKEGTPFFIVDQRQTQTSVTYEAYSLDIGAKLIVEIVAPFWPQDEQTSTVPAYILNFRVEKLEPLRWRRPIDGATRKGVLRFGLRIPPTEAMGQVAFSRRDGMVLMDYPVFAGVRHKTADGLMSTDAAPSRKCPVEGKASDAIVPLNGDWKITDNQLEVAFDVTADGAAQEFSIALTSYCGDALFERFGKPMALKYTRLWDGLDGVIEFVKTGREKLLKKSRAFDELWTLSDMPAAAQDLTALSFQSYLMCSLWAAGDEKAEWFSVWEGSCWMNSTVDVAYNEAMFYFACWPQLLEMIFEEWSHHGNDAAAEDKRLKAWESHGLYKPQDFPGKILEHDMGGGWTANGAVYSHAMPVEENANFLLLLYAHGKWWGRQNLFKKYNEFNKSLVEYLLWADSKGNGFPDRGTANTIDDATPAVQYGRDNVYLGIKRLAALHAAARMFTEVGESEMAKRCTAEVKKAVKTLNAKWLGDHWGVCLDKSAVGLFRQLPYKVLPGWDAYSLYTTNGLLPLMMIDDMPAGLSSERLRQDVVNACRASMTQYGCGHSSLDKKNMWVSMNVWRDCAAGYLGREMLANCERYWNQQVFGNTFGSEKANCFTETSLTNNLVWYPRGAAAFGLPLAMTRLIVDRQARKATIEPIIEGRWPLLALANWKSGKVPFVEVTRNARGQLTAKVEGKTNITLKRKGTRV